MENIVKQLSVSLRSYFKTNVNERMSDRDIDRIFDGFFGSTLQSQKQQKIYTKDELDNMDIRQLRVVCDELEISSKGKIKGNIVNDVMKAQQQAQQAHLPSNRCNDRSKDRSNEKSDAKTPKRRRTTSDCDSIELDSDEESIFNDLNKKTVNELKIMCKDKSLSCTGLKLNLIHKIMGKVTHVPKTPGSRKDTAKTPARPKTPARTPKKTDKPNDKHAEKHAETTTVDKPIEKRNADKQQRPNVSKTPRVHDKLKEVKTPKTYKVVPMVINNKSYDVDEENGYVFNKENQVIAMFKDNNIYPLTLEDIKKIRADELCVKYPSTFSEDSSSNEDDDD